MPAISVLMPVFNAQQFLCEAIESILSQSFKDFEFIIFNDGSTDDSLKIIEAYNDARITLFNANENGGYVKLLNLGLTKASGKYVARMDADDIALPDRFKKQYEFLESHPEYIVCGSWFTVIGNDRVVKLPVEDEDIKSKMLYITPFSHPSVMMRAEVFKRCKLAYEEDHMPAEDYELWTRLAKHGKFANLPEILLQYRVHHNNISFKKRSQQQIQKQYEARLNYIIKFFGAAIQPSEADILYTLLYKESCFKYEELLACGKLIQKLINENHRYPTSSLKVHGILAEKFFYRCTTSTNLGLPSFYLANQFDFFKPSLPRKLKLLIKALLKYKAN